MATNQTSYVTKLLFWNGADSFEYTPIFQDLITTCNVFIDVGANTGYYSLLAATQHPRIHVHAFEPAQGPLHYLRKNIDLNQFSNQISIHSIALSNSAGAVNFYEVKNKKYAYLPHNLGGVGSLTEDLSKTAYMVKTETIDRFAAQHSITSIDLMKIDTEGTEHFILEGAQHSIQRDYPIIICETLFNRIEDKLESIMKRHNYLFFNHDHGKLHRVDTLMRSHDNGVRDCFFVHPSKVQQIEKFIKQ